MIYEIIDNFVIFSKNFGFHFTNDKQIQIVKIKKCQRGSFYYKIFLMIISISKTKLKIESQSGIILAQCEFVPDNVDQC